MFLFIYFFFSFVLELCKEYYKLWGFEFKSNWKTRSLIGRILLRVGPMIKSRFCQSSNFFFYLWQRGLKDHRVNHKFVPKSICCRIEVIYKFYSICHRFNFQNLMINKINSSAHTMKENMNSKYLNKLYFFFFIVLYILLWNKYYINEPPINNRDSHIDILI